MMRVAASENVGLVGRRRELAALETAVDRARDGRGGIVLLVGEAGIGKTRTAQELVGLARSSGATVAHGVCYEDDLATPFGPWAEAAGQVVSSLDSAELSRRLGLGAAALAEVVPAVRAVVPDDAAAAALAPQETRLRLYESFSRLLLTAAEEPLVVVLDDLHWADAPSLDLLRYLARGLPAARLLLVGTYRDVEIDLAHPLTATLGAIERLVQPLRLRLRPFGRDETAELVTGLAGGPVHPGLPEAIRRETGGNPFFVTEVVHHLREEGRDLAGGGVQEGLGIPDSVRAAVARRLARLSPETGRMLSVASAFGGPFEFGVLAPLTGLPDEQLLDCIDEALRARMIRAVGARERYEFAHALVRHALYDELSPSRQARLHRRIAEALERSPGGRPHERAAELAGQYLLSASLPGAAHGIPHALTAAEAARRAYAHEGAVHFLRIARELSLGGAPSLRADVLCRLAVAEAEALLLEPAAESVAEAATALDESGAGAHATAGFLVQATWALQEAGAQQRLVDRLSARGLSMLGERRNLTWARLKLTEAPLEEIRVGAATAGRWLGFDPGAVEIARADGDERDWAKTLELMDWRSRAETDELRFRVERWAEPRAAIHGLGVVMRSLMLQHGAFAEAAVVARQLLDHSSRSGSLPGQAYALVYIAWGAELRGDREEALRTGEQAKQLVFRLGEAHRLRYSLIFLGVVDPDWAAIAAEREAAVADPRLPSWMTLLYLSQATSARARAGEREAARRGLEQLVPALTRMPPTTLNHNGAVANAVTAAWTLGEHEHAAPLRELALGLIEAGVGDYPGQSTELSVARMAALLGDPTEAAESFAAARSRLAASGQHSLLPVVDEDERRAASLAPRTRGFPAGLTARETEVLRLLSEGCTNREIGARLVLSVHTVERHLANVYRKIGARNRADATAFAFRHGLQRETT